MGKIVCSKHERAYEQGGQCDWCEPPSNQQIVVVGEKSEFTDPSCSGTWTQRPLPAGVDFSCIQTSKDGITWTARDEVVDHILSKMLSNGHLISQKTLLWLYGY